MHVKKNSATCRPAWPTQRFSRKFCYLSETFRMISLCTWATMLYCISSLCLEHHEFTFVYDEAHTNIWRIGRNSILRQAIKIFFSIQNSQSFIHSAVVILLAAWIQEAIWK